MERESERVASLISSLSLHKDKARHNTYNIRRRTPSLNATLLVRDVIVIITLVGACGIFFCVLFISFVDSAGLIHHAEGEKAKEG